MVAPDLASGSAKEVVTMCWRRHRAAIGLEEEGLFFDQAVQQLQLIPLERQRRLLA